MVPGRVGRQAVAGRERPAPDKGMQHRWLTAL